MKVLKKTNLDDSKKEAPFPINHIWEIHTSFKCPVIGACLSIDEHRKVLKRAGYQVKKLKTHQLHRVVMEHLGYENRISGKVENYLRHKYRNAISKFVGLDEDEFIDEWSEAFRTGKMDGVFYVAATRDDLSTETLENIFGEVHMLCHANLAEVMTLRRSLDLHESTNLKLAKLLKQEKKRSRDLKRENYVLRDSSNETRLIIDRLKRNSVETQPDEKGNVAFETENQVLREKLRNAEKQDEQQREHLCSLEREKRRLQIELFDLQATNKSLAGEVQGLISQVSGFLSYNENCNEECPKFQLCAKRILIVGGITKIKHLYRNLVESSGGQFDYHDGYMKNGKQNIEAQVMRSDLILCPVNCNSHGACDRVKKLCRKHNKPVKMLPSSSLSSISNALIDNSVQMN